MYKLLIILIILSFPVSSMALTVHLSGPGVINNYPPNNKISMRVFTEKTTGSVVLWGLQGGNSMNTVLGTMNIPAPIQYGFDSKAVPLNFPPGEYTLYAQEGNTIAFGAKMSFGKKYSNTDDRIINKIPPVVNKEDFVKFLEKIIYGEMEDSIYSKKDAEEILRSIKKSN